MDRHSAPLRYTSPLRDALGASLLARSKLRRRSIGYPEYEKWVMGRIEPYERVYLGPASVTIMDTKTKLVCYDHWPATEGELAREYLRTVWAPAETTQRPRPTAPGFGWQAPLYVTPVRSSALAYIDIVAAYWQLVSPWRPDDIPLPHGGYVPGTLDWLEVDQVADDRALRHAIVGSLFSNHLTVWCHGVPKDFRTTSAWTSPSLRRMCMGTLHALAAQVRRRFGLHAWLTDACIVDATVADDVCDFLALHWGISARIVAYGPGAVYNTTTYQVGEKQTENLTNGTVTPRTAPRAEHRGLRRVNGNALRRARIERLEGESAARPTSSAGGSGGEPCAL